MRAAFVVLTTYSLALSEAGQFGLIVTIQGLASFAFGYERHVDIQRRMVGEAESVFDQAVSRALSLFSVNYFVILPFFLLALITTVKIGFSLVALCAAIAISEQLMNQAYLMSMVNRRYLAFLFIATGKNILISGMVLSSLLFIGPLKLELVLSIWAGISTVAVVLSAFFWTRRKSHTKNSDGQTVLGSLRHQYKASRTHFLLGLVAILILQFDRLVVGAILPLETVGIYFRHVLLLSLVYQVFNIAFYNRIVPRVYLLAKTGTVQKLKSIVNREYFYVVLFVAFIIIVGLVLLWITGSTLTKRYSLNPLFFAGLLLASILRMRADFNGMIFNARMQEKTILKLQLLVFGTSAVLMIVFTAIFGIPGTIGASITASALYLGLTQLALQPMIENDKLV